MIIKNEEDRKFFVGAYFSSMYAILYFPFISHIMASLVHKIGYPVYKMVFWCSQTLA